MLSIFWFSVLGAFFVYGYLFDQLRGSTLSVMESVGLAPFGILFSPLTVAHPTTEGLLGVVFLVAVVGARLLISVAYKKDLLVAAPAPVGAGKRSFAENLCDVFLVLILGAFVYLVLAGILSDLSGMVRTFVYLVLPPLLICAVPSAFYKIRRYLR